MWQGLSRHSRIQAPLSDDASWPGVTVWLLDLTAPKCQIWHLTGGSILGLNLQFKESVTVRCGLKYNIDTRLDVYSLRIWLMIPIFEHFWNTQVIETCAKVGLFWRVQAWHHAYLNIDSIFVKHQRFLMNLVYRVVQIHVRVPQPGLPKKFKVPGLGLPKVQ